MSIYSGLEPPCPRPEDILFDVRGPRREPWFWQAFAAACFLAAVAGAAWAFLS